MWVPVPPISVSLLGRVIAAVVSCFGVECEVELRIFRHILL
jgi:hypothetical protein